MGVVSWAACTSSPPCHVPEVSLGSLFGRHTLASSVWWSIPTSNCPSTQRRLLKCTRERRGMRCRPTSMPSLTRPTGACCKVNWPWGCSGGLVTVSPSGEPTEGLRATSRDCCSAQAPPVLPTYCSRQECGVWQAALGDRRAVTEKGKKAS